MGSSALGHLLSAQFGRRLLVGVHRLLFFGVRFTWAANFQPAREFTGLDTLKALPCSFTKVECITAANRELTLIRLKDFVDHCESSDLLIVHFSGHGLYDEQLYLICNSTDVSNLDASAIGVDVVKRILRKCKARHKLLILDCCYAGGAFAGAFKGEQDIESVLSKEFEGSAGIILSACSRLERARELASLDGGTGFLSWALIASCTTRFGEVSPDHHSLSVMDIWRWMPTALAEVNSTLGKAFGLPRLVLVSQLEAGADGEIWLTEVRRDTSEKSGHDKSLYDRERFLKALLADHSSFMHDRLSSFVGREEELAEIRQRISEKQQTGGYVTITGQAGQGKSSIIATLIDRYQQESGIEKIAFHFIPFNPGPDHQVGLLRNLMARLILKYDLSDLYVASENRAALRDYLPKVLAEVVAKGGQEVIFVDGLDQLEEDVTGERDLSFLPNNSPPGVVFVLGTRPNDTLRPLELLKPRYEYQLPDLSRQDFDRVLQHRGVQLERGTANQLYSSMRGNALYLDLLAKELAGRETTASEAFIKQLTNNPEHLFSLAMGRLKRHSSEWREIIKPVLGVLLVAQEPLGVPHIRQILGIDDDRLREGIERLGGLIVRDWQLRYSLFHLKLYEYLRQDEQHPTKEYIFACDEEESWHKRLALWCEGSDLLIVWHDVKHDHVEQWRREYARQHYIMHLYQAKKWQQLFEVLDAAQYGRAKVNYDPSARLYAQDLRLGQRAAAGQWWPIETGIELLPHLWRYTLLRGSLVSLADHYPLEAFQLLVLLGQKARALGLTELLTDPVRKARILVEIARQIREQQGQEAECVEILWRAQEILGRNRQAYERAKVLCELGRTLADAARWKQAEEVWAETEVVIQITENQLQKADILSELGISLAWARAEKVIGEIENNYYRAKALCELGVTLAQAQRWERAEEVWAETERVIDTLTHERAQLVALYKLGKVLAQAQHLERAKSLWEKAEEIWDNAERMMDLEGDLERDAGRMSLLGKVLAQAQHLERAEAMWAETEKMIRAWQDPFQQFQAVDELMSELGVILVRMQQWKQVEAAIHAIREPWDRARVISEVWVTLAKAHQWEEIEIKWAKESLEWWGQGAKDWNQWRKYYEQRDKMVRELAATLKSARHWERALMMIERVWGTDLGEKVKVELGKALVQNRHWERAEYVRGNLKNAYDQAEVTRALGITLAQARQWEQAVTTIRTIGVPKIKARAMSELGATLAQAQLWEPAKSLWRETEVVIGTLKENHVRYQAITYFGTALAQAQQWERAELVINRIEAEYSRNAAMIKLGKVMVRAQQWERAERNIVKKIIDKVGNSLWRVRALSELGTALAQEQQWERANKLWTEAEMAIYAMEDDPDRDDAIAELAQALAQAQQWERAEELMDTISRDYISRDYRGERVLKIMVEVLADAGQWERVERLLEKVERSLEYRVAASPGKKLS